MSEVRATGSAASTARIARNTAGPAAPVGPPLAPPPADQTPAVNVGGALAGGQSRERIEGVVIGTDGAGLPVLRTAAGDFRVETALPLAERSRLILEIVHLTPVMTAKIVVQDGRVFEMPPAARLTPLHAEESAGMGFGKMTSGLGGAGEAQAAAGTAPPRRAGPRLRLAREWPALDETLALLQAQGAAAPLIAALPAADDRLASAVLSFFVALKENEIESWLGGEIGSTLGKAGRQDLAAQLAADFSDLAELARAEGPGAWQTLRFPLHLQAAPPDGSGQGLGDRLWPLALFVRHNTEAEGGDIRFVVDLPGTAFGPLQLDGLVRTPPRLDLILRAYLPLPTTVQAALSDLVARTGAGLGYPSRLIFEAVPHFPVNPLQDIGAGRPLSDLRV